MGSTGILYLLPVTLGEVSENRVIPEYNLQLIRGLKHFIAEDAKTARRFLKWCAYPVISEAQISLLNEHTEAGSHDELLQALVQGHDVGLMSDAGCPGIADPGADVVRLAHRKGIHVTPLVGPSSIVLAIMASGFNGQNFAFNGYLPVDKTQRQKRIRDLEQTAKRQYQAQFFIETPYRNMPLLEDLLKTLHPDTQLCIASNVSLPSEKIISKTVSAWKNKLPDLHKQPAVFGIY